MLNVIYLDGYAEEDLDEECAQSSLDLRCVVRDDLKRRASDSAKSLASLRKVQQSIKRKGSLSPFLEVSHGGVTTRCKVQLALREGLKS